MDYEIGMDILSCAIEQKEEEILFNRWIHLLSDISFDEFKNQIGYKKPQDDKNMDVLEILKSVKKIMGG